MNVKITFHDKDDLKTTIKNKVVPVLYRGRES